MREPTHWQKSTLSEGGDGNTCVEVPTMAGVVHLRESDDPTTEIPAAPRASSGLLSALKEPYAPRA
ncbi:DUF397 domain-containing protein [Streptomyces sp. NPDC016845]|uniref:DUF397 domain-containing protein n=1 Tax=Streptomyces sp. NPDC016845 TaxID=3364972 RepID=UPI0037BC688F